MIFAWLMMINRLATIDNLTRRGWLLPNMCIMCKAQEESVTHLFQSCLIAREIRAYIHATFNVQLVIPNKYTADNSFQMLTDPRESCAARKLELTTCFVLWRERCRRIFADKIADQLSMVREYILSMAAGSPMHMMQHQPSLTQDKLAVKFGYLLLLGQIKNLF